jgi:uncharacterized protein
VLRAVLDSNVLIAWFTARSGTLFELRTHWLSGDFRLVISEHILAEVARAWAKPYWRVQFSTEDISQRLDLLLNAAELTQLTEIVAGVAVHSEDDFVLATAASAQADYLVTGDKQLREIGQYWDTRILTPQEFVLVLDQLNENAVESPQ